MMQCPFCGKETAAGRNCVHCGGPLRKGAVAPKVTTKNCPNCKAAVQPGDIICVACGTNLLTGQIVLKPGGEPPKRVGRRARRSLLWGGAAVLIAAALVGLGAGAAWLLRDPVETARKMAVSGNSLDALALLQKHVERRPEDRNARLLQGKLYWQANQPDRAAEALEAAYRQQEEDVTPALMAVAAAAKLGGQEGPKRQAALLRDVVRRHPDSQRAWHLLALALGAMGLHADQAAAIKDAGQAGAASGTSMGALSGVSRGLEGDLEGAEKSLRTLTAAAPDNGDAAAALGFVLSLQGREDEAAGALESALERNTTVSGQVRLRLGLAELRRGNYERAISLLGPARTELPDDPRAPFFHALALQNAGLAEEALTEFERLSTGSGPYAGQAALQMATLYLKMDSLDRAGASIRRATELGLSSARMLTLQGRVHALQGNNGEAEESYRRAMQAEPDYPAAHLEMGLLQVSRNALPEGIRELERYVELARAAGGGGRVNEIEVLVSQLRQTMQAS